MCDVPLYRTTSDYALAVLSLGAYQRYRIHLYTLCLLQEVNNNRTPE